MGNEGPDEIILEIKVKKEEVEKNVMAAKAALKGLRAELKETQKEYDKGNITKEEYAKSEQAIKGHIAATTAVIKEGEQTLKDYAKAEKEAQAVTDALKNSMKGQGESTAELQKRIAGLAAEFREEAQDAKSLGSSLDSVDDKIAKLKKELGGLTKAQRDNKDIGGVLVRQINSLEKAQDDHAESVKKSKKTLRDFIGDIDVLGFNVGSTVESFKSGASGAQLFGKAIFTSRGALIALAAVPIIAVLSGLYIILTKSQKGMDFLERATAGVTAVFTSFGKAVIRIGEALANAWENPKKAVAEFGEFVQTNLMNRFKALAVIIDGISHLNFAQVADGTLQLATGAEKAYTNLKNVYKQGSDVAALSQRIREEEIKLNTERAKSEKVIEAQKQIAEDTTKSFETRRKAEQAAIAESIKIQKSEETLQLKRIKLAKDEAKAGFDNAKDRAKVAEEEAKLEEIRKNRIGERTELQNQLNAINTEQTAKDLENAKKAAQERVDEAEVALIVAKRKGEGIIEIEKEIYQRTLEYIQKKRDAELVGVKKGSQERKVIIERANTEQLEAVKAYTAKVAELTYNARVSEINSALAFARKGSADELELRIANIEIERNKRQEVVIEQQRSLEKQYKEKLITEQQYINASKRLQIEEGAIVNTAARAISDARLAYERDRINKEAELQAQALQAELDLGDQTLEHERDVAGKRIELERETQLKLLALEEITQKERDKREAAIEATATAKRRELAEQRVADARATALAISDIELSIAKEGSKKQLEEQKKRLKIERDQAIAAAKGNKELIAGIEKDYQDKSKKAQEKYNYTLYEKIVITANQMQSTLSSIVDAQTARQTKALDAQQEAQLSSAALSSDARAKIEADFAKKREKIEKEAAEKRKRIASLENLIATAQAVTASFKLLPPFSYINAALVTAQGIAQQVIIDNTKFQSGGPVFGPSHEQGGIKMYHKSGAYMGEFEGEEIILTKGVYRDPVLRAKASALNVAGGGKAFASYSSSAPNYSAPKYTFPKYTGPVYNTQHATPQFRYGGALAGFDTNAIAAAIVQGMQGVTIVTDIQEVTKAQANVKKTQANNDLGYNRKN